MGDEWVSGDANPNTEVDLLRECIAAGLAIMNGFPWRSDKFVHSAAVELAAHDEKVRAEDRERVLAEVRAEIGELTNIVGHHFVTTDSADGEVYGGYAMHTDEQARAILFAMLDRIEGE
jgi:hypothetical protein